MVLIFWMLFTVFSSASKCIQFLTNVSVMNSVRSMSFLHYLKYLDAQLLCVALQNNMTERYVWAI